MTARVGNCVTDDPSNLGKYATADTSAASPQSQRPQAKPTATGYTAAATAPATARCTSPPSCDCATTPAAAPTPTAAPPKVCPCPKSSAAKSATWPARSSTHSAPTTPNSALDIYRSVIIDQLTQFGQFGLIPGALNNGSLIGIQQMNTFGSGASGLFSWTSLGGNGSVADGAETLGAGGLASGGLGGLSPAAGAAGPVGASGAGGAPLLAGVASQASSVGGLAAPASWAAETAPAGGAAPGGGAGAASASAAPGAAAVTTLPAGMCRRWQGQGRPAAWVRRAMALSPP